jgi:hypothetical protein
MEFEFSRQIFEKYSNIKFHEYLSSCSRVVPCGQTDGRTDVTKLIVAFRNFAKAAKSETIKATLMVLFDGTSLYCPGTTDLMGPVSTVLGRRIQSQLTKHYSLTKNLQVGTN